MEVSAPRGSFTIASGSNPVVLLSAGIGITPLLAMLHSLASDAEHKDRPIWWCYGARNSSEHPFAAEVKELLARLPRARSWVAYSRPLPEDRPEVNYNLHGHLDMQAVESLQSPKDADYYLCGPAAFLAELSAGLKSWGVPASGIHSEAFGAGEALTPGIAPTSGKAPHAPAGVPGTGPRVSFTRTGLSVPWNVSYGSLLELAEACDVPVKWSCRTGVCHTCESGLIDGKLKYGPEPLDPPAEGRALICCSVPLSEIELDL